MIGSSVTGGSAGESISLSLAAGVYFVRVYRRSGDTDYTLRLAQERAGNTIGTARNVSALPGTAFLDDSVGAIDPNDYYRVHLSHGGTLTASLTGLTADADLQIIRDADGDGVVDPGEILRTSSAGGTAAESISVSLAAGVYFVRVYRRSGDTHYTLRLTDDLAGDTIGTARNVGILSGTAFFDDFVGAADTDDYYRVALSATRTLNLSLTGLTADADLQLIRDADGDLRVDPGEVIRSSTLPGSASESITVSLAAGVYFVRVDQYSGDTHYDLNMTV